MTSARYGLLVLTLAAMWSCDDGGTAAGDGAPPGADAAADTGMVVGGQDGEPPRDGGRPDAGPDAGDAARPPADAEAPDSRVPVDAALGDAAAVEDAAPGEDAAVDASPDEGVVVSPCPDGRPPRAEICDGVDDDCDGATDEGLGLAEACEGVGRCGVGFIECDDEGGVRCSTDPGGSTSQEAPERCNGVDDDCDGDIDESPDGFAQACYEGLPGTEGVGECRAGTRVCVDGRLGECVDQRVTSPEICNGRDDDCDGSTDEDQAAGEQACGAGVCRAASTPGGCVDGREVACRPGPPTGDDADCDGVDDDCDGAVDEAYAPLAGCGVGVCADRARPGRCEAGVEVPCVPAPPAQGDLSCDGADDDCDGRADEDYQAVTCGTGVCREGAAPSVCAGGVERICMPGPPDGDDSDCDGRDNDCDGRIDEGYRPVVACGEGICALNPQPSRCENGREIACQPGLPVGGDLDCNGVDDDCDGRADEGYVVDRDCGRGVCAETALPSFCRDGVETLCRPGAPAAPVDDDCDGRDSDCDGQIDDEVVRLIGGERRLTQHMQGAIQPSLARSGDVYGMVWSDNRDGSAELYYLRLDAAGQPVGAAVRLQLIGGAKLRPTIAPDGAGGFGVAWHNTRTGRAQVHFARIAADGGILVPDLRLVETQANAFNPRIDFNGQDFAVVWSDQRTGVDQVRLQRLSAVGVPLGDAIVVSQGEEPATVPTVAHRGAARAVAYNIDRQGDFDIVLQPVDADGNPQGARQIVSAGMGNSNAPTLAPSPDGWAVAWYDTRDDNTEIYAALAGANGARIGGEIRLTDDPRPSFLPALVAGANGYGLAWSDRRSGNDEVWFQHLDAQARPFGQPERISDGVNSSFGATVVFTAGTYAIGWYDRRHGPDEIYFGLGPIGCGPPAP